MTKKRRVERLESGQWSELEGTLLAPDAAAGWPEGVTLSPAAEGWEVGLPAGARVWLEGGAESVAGGVRLPTAEAGRVCFLVPEGLHEVRPAEGRCIVRRLEGGSSAGFEGMAARVTAAMPSEVPAPDVAALCEAYGVQPWLFDAVSAAASSPGTLDRVAAAGLLFRLWEPQSREDGRRAAAALFGEGEPGPGQRAAGWLRSLGAGACESLSRAVVAAMPALYEDLEEVGRAPHPEGLRHLLRRRDDLRSAEVLLNLHRQPGPVAALLRRFDAALERTLVPHAASVPADERLQAVARREPESWWARPATWSLKPAVPGAIVLTGPFAGPKVVAHRDARKAASSDKAMLPPTSEVSLVASTELLELRFEEVPFEGASLVRFSVSLAGEAQTCLTLEDSVSVRAVGPDGVPGEPLSSLEPGEPSPLFWSGLFAVQGAVEVSVPRLGWKHVVVFVSGG